MEEPDNAQPKQLPLELIIDIFQHLHNSGNRQTSAAFLRLDRQINDTLHDRFYHTMVYTRTNAKAFSHAFYRAPVPPRIANAVKRIVFMGWAGSYAEYSRLGLRLHPRRTPFKRPGEDESDSESEKPTTILPAPFPHLESIVLRPGCVSDIISGCYMGRARKDIDRPSPIIYWLCGSPPTFNGDQNDTKPPLPSNIRVCLDFSDSESIKEELRDYQDERSKRRRSCGWRTLERTTPREWSLEKIVYQYTLLPFEMLSSADDGLHSSNRKVDGNLRRHTSIHHQCAYVPSSSYTPDYGKKHILQFDPASTRSFEFVDQVWSYMQAGHDRNTKKQWDLGDDLYEIRWSRCGMPELEVENFWSDQYEGCFEDVMKAQEMQWRKVKEDRSTVSGDHPPDASEITMGDDVKETWELVKDSKIRFTIVKQRKDPRGVCGCAYSSVGGAIPVQ